MVLKLDPKTIDFIRCGKPVVTFKQEDVPGKKFFELAKGLGFRVAVTGGLEFTHEFQGTKEDFLTVIEMCNE